MMRGALRDTALRTSEEFLMETIHLHRHCPGDASSDVTEPASSVVSGDRMLA